MQANLITHKVLIFLIFVLFSVPAAGQENSPRIVVAEFQATLLEAMKKAEILGVKGRYQMLVPPIEKAFHIPLMIRIVTGGYWNNANKSQQRDIINAFKRMNISTLATLFDGYSGQSFKIVGDRPGPQKTLLVDTKLSQPDKSPVDIAYVMKSINNRWRIIDVIVDNGISELTVRRSEYHRVLKDDGMTGLINTLNSKADELIEQ
jgi:phospholipid transport system substrate-binding protein